MLQSFQQHAGGNKRLSEAGTDEDGNRTVRLVVIACYSSRLFQVIEVSWLSVCCNGTGPSQEPSVLVAVDNTDLGLTILFFTCRYFRRISQALRPQGIDSYKITSLRYLSCTVCRSHHSVYTILVLLVPTTFNNSIYA